jgi:hypothetical protein
MRHRLTVTLVLVGGSLLCAQAQERPERPPLLSTVPSPPAGVTPVPAEMSGQPLQVGDLPPGVVVIRVIRRSFADNVASHRVQLRVGSQPRVVESTTDASGRARFDGLQVGETVRATTSIDGETLDSRSFALPAEGGVRMLLVAGVGAGAAGGVEPIVVADSAPSGTLDARPALEGQLVPVTAASVAITIFALTSGAILWSVRRRPASSAATRPFRS